LLLGSCGGDDDRPGCTSDSECLLDARCIDGVCRNVGTDAGPRPVDAGRATDAGGGVDAGADGGEAVDAGMDDAGSASQDGGPIDAAVGVADVGPPPDGCGGYRQECCAAPAEACTEGGCIGGRCAAFGGVYVVNGSPEDEDFPVGGCALPNPYTGTCACGEGFVSQRLEDADSSYDEGYGHWKTWYVCSPREDIPDADFRGGYGEVPGPFRDGDSCDVTGFCEPNSLTASCGCPEGADPLVFDSTHVFRGTLRDCGTELTFCQGVGGFTWGGAYQTLEDSRCVGVDPCKENPVTGGCFCPIGFSPASFAMSGLDDEWGSCRGRLHVCYRTP